MFWDSVLAGLRVFIFWETYVATLEYVAIVFIPMALLGMMVDRKAGLVGCLGMLFIPARQVAACAVFVITLSPIILGVAGDAVWSLPWNIVLSAPLIFLRILGVMLIAYVIISIIPIINQFQGFHTMVLGAFALKFVLSIFRPETIDQINFVPGFWFMIGLLVAGAIVSWAGMLAAALLAAGLSRHEERAGTILLPIASVFGFVPLFMYGAWLGAQLR